MKQANSDSLMDTLVTEWAQECPDLDASAMAVVGRIMRLGQRFENEATRALKPLGIAYTDFDILATLRRSGSPYTLTPGQLADAVLLTSGAMTAALERLEKAGLISRHTSTTDRRSKAARLTNAGKKLAKNAAAARFDIATQAVASLPARSHHQLIALLDKLGD
ncbi:MAG: MarR family transcriptional regulator [Pseudomonadota bacterium]